MISVSRDCRLHHVFFLLKTLKHTQLLGAIVLLALWTYTTKYLGDLFLAECLSFFLTGVAIWFATQIKRSVYYVIVSLVTTFVAVLLVGQGDLSSHPTILISILFLTAILDALHVPLDQKVLIRFGQLIYSAFLWHVPIELLINLVLEGTSATTEVYKFEIFFITYFAVVYLIANLSFIYNENPSKLSLLRRFSLRQS